MCDIMNKQQKINELKKELVELKEMNNKLHNTILRNIDRINQIEETLNWVDVDDY